MFEIPCAECFPKQVNKAKLFFFLFECLSTQSVKTVLFASPDVNEISFKCTKYTSYRRTRQRNETKRSNER